MRNLQALGFLPDRFGDLHCAFMSEAGQHERKLFSAVTGSDIAGAARLGGNALRNLRENFVSCSMTVGLIEKLEVVDIDELNRNTVALAASPLPLLFEPQLERPPVAELGQWVGGGQTRELILCTQLIAQPKCEQP